MIYYIDGSKWEANANRYKVVWRKSIARYKEWALSRIDEILKGAQHLQNQEDDKYGKQDLATHSSAQQVHIVLNSKELQQHISHISKLVQAETDKQRGKKLLGQRNSYAKTDEDATGMRMKDGRVRPGYNIQITTNQQFILNASVHQNASDSPTLALHVEKLFDRAEGWWMGTGSLKAP